MSNHNFVDSSSNNYTVTRFGTTSQGSFVPQPPSAGVEYDISVHGGSCYFEGTTSSYLTVTHNGGINVGTGDFTFETWMYPTNNDTGTMFSSGSYSMFRNTNGTVSWSHTNYGIYTTTATAPLNTWTHYAISRTSGTMKVFVNGVQQTSAASSENYTFGTSLTIGKLSNNTWPFAGFLAGYRFVGGTGLYSSAFTPAVALTAVTNTKILLKFTNASVFDSRCKMTPIVYGGVTTDINTYKYGNASISFDGVAGSHLLIPGNGDVWMGTGDFTIETWIRPTVISGLNRGIFGINTAAQIANGFLLAINQSTNKLGMRIAGSTWGTLESSTSISLNTWTHVAMVRTGGNVKVYINGTQEISTTTGGTTNFTAGNFVIGRGHTDVDERFQGFMDDFRVTKGVARYTANFTAPTTALPKK